MCLVNEKAPAIARTSGLADREAERAPYLVEAADAAGEHSLDHG